VFTVSRGMRRCFFAPGRGDGNDRVGLKGTRRRGTAGPTIASSGRPVPADTLAAGTVLVTLDRTGTTMRETHPARGTQLAIAAVLTCSRNDRSRSGRSRRCALLGRMASSSRPPPHPFPCSDIDRGGISVRSWNSSTWRWEHMAYHPVDTKRRRPWNDERKRPVGDARAGLARSARVARGGMPATVPMATRAAAARRPLARVISKRSRRPLAPAGAP
jgi:hypothetical protein